MTNHSVTLEYPQCDFCGVIHPPWYGGAISKGEDSPYIHACSGCRHLLPSHTALPVPVVAQLAKALEELINLMEDTRRGEYTPDSFTTQPARIALAAYRKGGDV